MGSAKIIIPECVQCGLPAPYQCGMTADQYCSKHKRECCYLVNFSIPSPKYTSEEKWY